MGGERKAIENINETEKDVTGSRINAEGDIIYSVGIAPYKDRLETIFITTAQPPFLGCPCRVDKESNGSLSCKGCRLSKVPSYPLAILRVFPTVVLLQIVFFTDNLAVEQPYGCTEIEQKYPV
jgi:hypothetical protein